MKRWWGIRHIRWYVERGRLAAHLDQMRSVGCRIAANSADIERLEAIRKGKA